MSTAEKAKDVLCGYGRANGAKLASLLAVQDWRGVAQQELERRATSIVQVLDDSLLEDIASGSLDMRAMISQVMDELRATDGCQEST